MISIYSPVQINMFNLNQRAIFPGEAVVKNQKCCATVC